jgi:hypothetical protein
MRISILFDFDDGPGGGGTQFLSYLKKELEERGKYSDMQSADCVILNSHHFGKLGAFILKLTLQCIKNPKLVILHRLDGLLSKGRGNQSYLLHDRMMSFCSSKIANGVVYQSEWARMEFRNVFGETALDVNSKVIYNSAKMTFKETNHKPFDPAEKINIVYSSWSNNAKKGFCTLQLLDAALDYSRYNFYFVGNLPSDTSFRNIITLEPKASDDLAVFYSGMHIFLAPMIDDACSNAIIEAVRCKLLLVTRDSGGNKEIMGPNSILFDTDHQAAAILNDVDSIRYRLIHLQSPVEYPSADLYIRYAEDLANEQKRRKGRIINLIRLYGWCLLVKYHTIFKKKSFFRPVK